MTLEVQTVAELFIGGTWRDATDGSTRTITCPADGRPVAAVSEASETEALQAVEAARQAFDHGPWREFSATERARILYQVADRLEEQKADVARLESLDTGKRFVESELDVDDVVGVFRYYASLTDNEGGRVVETGQPDVVSRVVHEPIGVCGLITPWNYPLLQTSWKVAPALAAGNTFVLKPSELTPSTAIWLTRTLHELGVPDGVVNLVLGPGDPAGAALASAPQVDLVSFTGGVVTGRSIMAAASPTIKRVALELGGKNPNIVFADADLEAALDLAVTAAFLNSGQVCSAGTRLIIEESIHDEFVDELVARTSRIRLGGPFDSNAETGPLISTAHRTKVERYVATGVREGATLRVGGARPDDPELDKGIFYLPTVLDHCTTAMSVVQEESFGPVLTVETFDGTDHDSLERAAAEIANDTIYGLAGAVWTENAGRAERMARRMRTGTVWINDFHPYVPQAEWGGYKQSGNGRELGVTGLEEYRETKHIWHNIRPHPSGWFGQPNERDQA